MPADRERTSTIDTEKVSQNHHATASIENETAATAAASEGSSAREPEETAQQMTLDDLSAYYGDFRAVKNISLKLEPNKITALIGPSGSGKSTMLRCLNRMHEMARGGRVEGKVLLDGEDIYEPHVDPVNVRRKVGMIFQKPNPFPTMSIYDNVVAGLKLERRHRKSHLDEVVEQTLRQAALWDEVKDRLNRPATALSGGQQQRLCIARTIAVKPEVILMDEPASALDPIATLKIEDLMQELTKNYTIMVVTHNMQQAARVSDYTAFLTMSEDRAGELIEAGATQDIFTNPKHELTEQYITGRFG